MISCAEIARLGVVLPDPPAPRGDYVPDVVHRGVVYVSGQLLREGNLTITPHKTTSSGPAVHAARTERDRLSPRAGKCGGTG